MSALKIPAEWTPDCQGKWDFDGELVSVSTRYWPRGGGFHALGPEGWQGNEARPEIQPSARSSILLCLEGGDAITLAEQDFKGDTEADVKRQAEVWAQAQFDRVAGAMRREFGIGPSEVGKT